MSEPNPGKNINIDVDDKAYERHPIKTHVITPKDRWLDLVQTYIRPIKQKGDVLFISERVIAIMQGRAYPISDIHPSWLSRFLVRFVHKSPYGIGLGSPWTMELALREAGSLRLLFAAAATVITKPFGIKGIFYRIAGNNINAIDGPCSYTLSPYNQYAKLGPKNPDKVAQEISDRFSLPVVIIDANDLGVEILGTSQNAPSEAFCKRVFRDNPLGQTNESTPLCLVRNSQISVLI